MNFCRFFLEREAPYKALCMGVRGRVAHSSYCAVTTDIQLTMDDKPLILLIAQLTQILIKIFSFNVLL